MHSQEQVESVVNDQIQSEPPRSGRKPRTVQSCDFRAAGRLSNENARLITAIHETFARHLTAAMDAYLGGDPKVKLATLDQISLRDHITAVDPLSYIAPFSIGAVPGTVLVEFDIELAFPIIDLLLGGNGAPAFEARELSEIEEEIMRDLTSLIARQAETAWRLPEMSLTARERVESSSLGQVCSPRSSRWLNSRWRSQASRGRFNSHCLRHSSTSCLSRGRPTSRRRRAMCATFRRLVFASASSIAM
jgi:flagellar motor switch protein FliM